MSGRFLTPNDDDLTALAEQWLAVADLTMEAFGVELDRSEASLGLLQRVVDDRLIDEAHTYGLQCLGVVFGMVYRENQPGFDWWIVEDEHGRDPCLRYRETSLQLNVLTMLSKRIEQQRPVDVSEMYRGTVELVRSGIEEGRW